MIAAIMTYAPGEVEVMIEAYRPRLCRGLHSIASGTAVVYSPPRKIPSTNRNAISRPTDHTPIVSWPGRHAVASVIVPNPPTATSVVRLRPTVSAKWPKMIAPSGRPMSVEANTSDDSRAVVLALRFAAWK